MADIITTVRNNSEVFSREFETITHNLANAQTPGFKRRVTGFQAALKTAQLGSLGKQSSGEIVSTQKLDFSQGNLVQTDRSLDLALSGPGFFVVESPQGPLYTRNGTFHTNNSNQLVDSEGHTVAGQGGPITVPPSANIENIQIEPDGTVRVDQQTLGQLKLISFPNHQHRLIPAGSSTFRASTDAVAQTPEKTLVQQGYRESSNVNTVQELVGMMTVSRLYEANMNFISARREAGRNLMSVAMG